MTLENVKSGKLTSTDEVLQEISDCVSDVEYCNLIEYLMNFSARDMREELKKWALAHEDSLVRQVGDWM